MTTFKAIRNAARVAEFTGALQMVQSALGVESGDNASAHFSGDHEDHLERHWGALSETMRRDILANYAAEEIELELNEGGRGALCDAIALLEVKFPIPAPVAPLKAACEFAAAPRSEDCFSVPLDCGDATTCDAASILDGLAFDVERCAYMEGAPKVDAMAPRDRLAYYASCDKVILESARAFLAANPAPSGEAASGVSFYVYLSDY